MFVVSKNSETAELSLRFNNFSLSQKSYHVNLFTEAQGYLVLDFLPILAEKSRAGARSYSGEI